MGTKLPTKVSLGRGIALCLMAVLSPKSFAEAEAADTRLLNAAASAPADTSVLKVRRALVGSLVLVLVSGGIGCSIGFTLTHSFGPACFSTISVLQTFGALIILWATLAVRGWDIQTLGGVTLTERVNQWIYRFCIAAGQ
jgi:hypothetical protein